MGQVFIFCMSVTHSKPQMTFWIPIFLSALTVHKIEAQHSFFDI